MLIEEIPENSTVSSSHTDNLPPLLCLGPLTAIESIFKVSNISVSDWQYCSCLFDLHKTQEDEPH